MNVWRHVKPYKKALMKLPTRIAPRVLSNLTTPIPGEEDISRPTRSFAGEGDFRKPLSTIGKIAGICSLVGRRGFCGCGCNVTRHWSVKHQVDGIIALLDL